MFVNENFSREESDETMRTLRLLWQMGIPCHRIGFQLLCIAIPRYNREKSVSLSKELYPDIAAQLQLTDGRAVERDIRGILQQSWSQRDAKIWSYYFPGEEKCPSNKHFLAVMAEYL